MVMAKLHTICGNCGCNNDFILEVERDGDWLDPEEEDETMKEDRVVLICNNCSTIHDLRDNVKNI